MTATPGRTMGRSIRIIELPISHAALKGLDSRTRNQVVGCMHAHNELVVLNRILMFSMNMTSEGEFHDSAQSVQMWCLLQLLAGKIVETWKLLCERFLKASPTDEAVKNLKADQTESLDWLRSYFGNGEKKQNSLIIIRDKTAFHFDKINLADSVDNLAPGENVVFLATHPANSLYYLGSAMILRTLFIMIADAEKQAEGATHQEKVDAGFHITIEDAKHANYHMSVVLYGLIEYLLEKASGCPLETLDYTNLNVMDVSDPEDVGLPIVVIMSQSGDDNP